MISRFARAALGRIELFSKYVLRMPLREYQIRPLHGVVRSVLQQDGLEFLLIFPRQSGKNEAVAHLLVYLLNVLQRSGGNVVYAATGDGLGRGIQRLEERLDNPWNRGRWGKSVRPSRRTLGRAGVVFLSSHPQASARGETAHWLLVVDEFQDQPAAHMEAVFEPMRAANNASALYIGTVRIRSDALWRKKEILEAEQARDGRQRVFLVSPEAVIRENPAYGHFLASRVARLGRDHPIIASEYFLEPMDGQGLLFPARRQGLMRGDHSRRYGPALDDGGVTRIACVDIGGQDEAATTHLVELENPARDYTVATLFEVVFCVQRESGRPRAATATPLPVYRAIDVFVDHGSRHFQAGPGRPALVDRLLAWLQMWQANHLIVDKGGVGEGIYDWLCASVGRRRVSGYDFQTPGKKASLGAALLSLVETGRFKYWARDWGRSGASKDEASAATAVPAGDVPLSDGWWFWQQVAACTYDLPLGGRFDRDLRWGVPAGSRVDTPAGPRLVHDDRLLSAALIAAADGLYQRGELVAGQARSALIRPGDPLDDLTF